MYIKNEDLEFLIHLENRLGETESWSADVYRLWELIERLMIQRDVQRLKTYRTVTMKRKIDKTYGRPKKKGHSEVDK